MQALARMQAGRARQQPDAARSPRTVHDVRQALLAQSGSCAARRPRCRARTTTPSNCWPSCSRRSSASCARTRPATACCTSLVVPLLRLVLKDRGFFVQHQPPGAAVAQRGGRIRRQLDVGGGSRSAAQRPAAPRRRRCRRPLPRRRHVFEAANQRVQQHLQAMARRAEVAERRHVDAARGKEKLELAKRRAARSHRRGDARAEAAALRADPAGQAWTDVLTLTQLRNGEESAEWQQQVDGHDGDRACDIAQPSRLATGQSWPRRSNTRWHWSATTPTKPPTSRGRLTAHVDDDDDDPASRTELAMKLKARGRLGQEASRTSPNCRRATNASSRLRTAAHAALRHLVRIRHQPAGRRGAPAPVLVQPAHRPRAVRQPARPARGRAVAGQPGARRSRRTRPASSPPNTAAWSTAPGIAR